MDELKGQNYKLSSQIDLLEQQLRSELQKNQESSNLIKELSNEKETIFSEQESKYSDLSAKIKYLENIIEGLKRDSLQ